MYYPRVGRLSGSLNKYQHNSSDYLIFRVRSELNVRSRRTRRRTPPKCYVLLWFILREKIRLDVLSETRCFLLPIPHTGTLDCQKELFPPSRS